MGVSILRYILFAWLYLFISQPWVVAQKVSPIKINASNAAYYRDSLNTFIFGTTGFPYDISPDSVITNVNSIDLYNGDPYTSIRYPNGNLDSVDKIVVSIANDSIDFPSKTKVYLFHPHTGNGKLFIYQSGHCAGVTISEDIFGNNGGVEPGIVIPALLEKGYTVLAVPMLNYQTLPPAGVECGFNNHDQLFSDGHYSNPLSLFFKPLIASLNFLGRSNYSSIYMCGLSGGGWTTSLYPAIDSSITYSFPVAGSWPLPVSALFGLSGDYEQTIPPLYSYFLDYHEIYTLACLSPARKMLQINNRYDPCCFAGSTAHIYYVDSVARALQGSGGKFKFYLDETGTNHAITARAIKVMLTFIANEEASLQTMPADSISCGTNYFYDIKNNFTVNTATENSSLKYSLLKAPAWLSLDSTNGTLQGIVPAGTILMKQDSISFKVEDSTGRFVVYNYILNKKRESPLFFTKAGDSSTIWFLPPFSHSIQAIEQSAGNLFYFNNSLLSITSLSIVNNSVIRINLNLPLNANDSIGYHGFSGPPAITYNNGLKIEDFGLTKINQEFISANYAKAGMMRFNTETKKFEYFNGALWIELN